MKRKVFYLLLTSGVYAEVLDKSIEITTKGNDKSIQTQKKIDNLVEKKEVLYNKFKSLSNVLKSLNQYNKELQAMASSQENEKISIKNQLGKIDETKRDILPLIRNMLLSLEEFVNKDTPFLYKERTQRVQRLKKLVKRSDVSIASKYKSVMEAFEIENEYGRTIETYNDILTHDNLSKNVKFLRLGRVAFYYVSEDNKECGIWDNRSKSWLKLDNSYTHKLNEAIKVASNKSVPNLLTIPMFTPKAI